MKEISPTSTDFRNTDIFLKASKIADALACDPGLSLQSCPTLCEPVDCSPPVPLSMGKPRQQYWSVSRCFLPGSRLFPKCDPVWMENKSIGVVTFSWGEQSIMGIWNSHWVSLRRCGWLNHWPQDWTQTRASSSLRRGWKVQLVSHSRCQSSIPRLVFPSGPVPILKLSIQSHHERSQWAYIVRAHHE